MSSSILVPLDGSLLAEQALPTAMSLVKQRHGRLELALVHEPQGHDGLADAPWNSMTESMQDRYMSDKAAQLSAACKAKVGHALLQGDVARELCRRAREVDADMIVMSTHGRTGLTRAFAGSVADAVIRESRVPVLLLRQSGADAPPRAPALSFKKILVPIDDSEASRQIFGAAASLAARGETEFVLVRVVAPVHYVMDGALPYGYVAGPVDEEATRLVVSEADRELTGAAADLGERSGCDIDPHVIVADHVGRAIVDFARKMGVDLIAMTTHGRGASRMLLGSVTDAVLRGANIPMLVLRPTSA